MKISTGLACNSSLRFGKLSAEQFDEAKKLNKQLSFSPKLLRTECLTPLDMLYKLDNAIDNNKPIKKDMEKQLIQLIHEANTMRLITFFKELTKETCSYKASEEVFENILNRFKTLGSYIPLPPHCELPEKEQHEEQDDSSYHPKIHTSWHTEY